MSKDCLKKDHNCGDFAENVDKETKLKHLTECKEKLQNRIKEIDEIIHEIKA